MFNKNPLITSATNNNNRGGSNPGRGGNANNTADENGCDVFSRLLSQQQQEQNENRSAADSSRNTTGQTVKGGGETKNRISTQQSSLSSSILTELESTLFNNKPLNLDPSLFPNGGVKNRQIVEITGRVDSGKSELMRHFIARCIMPPKWRMPTHQNDDDKTDDYIEIDLREYSCYDPSTLTSKQQQHLEPGEMPQVILVQTDSKLNPMRLFTLIESRLRQALGKHASMVAMKSDVISLDRRVNEFVHACLKSLVVYECYNREQFLLALAALESYIQSVLASPTCSPVQRAHMIPIFIDSINSNFEILDRYDASLGIGDKEHTEKFTVQLIRSLCTKLNVCVVASRCDLSVFANETSYQRKWQALVNLRCELESKSSHLTDRDRIDDDENDIDDDHDHEGYSADERREAVRLETKRFIKVMDISQENSCRKVIKTARFLLETSGFRLEKQ